MPDIGGADNVDVIEVLVKVGDTIQKEMPLITMESDKATMDLPSSEAGVIKEIKVKVGDKVSQGTTIALIETDGSTEKTEDKPEKKPTTIKKAEENITTEKPVTSKPTEKLSKEEEAQVLATPSKESPAVHAGPAVRKLARELGVDLEQIKPTGPKDRIVFEDVHGYVKSRLSGVSRGDSILPAAPEIDFTKFGAVDTQPLSRIKKLTGKNLQRNWLLVPHVTQFGEADVTEMEEFRQAQKTSFEKQKIKLTPLVFIMKAVVGVLKAFPQFNSSLDASGENLILKKYFHIGVAVDTPEGLVVPVIRDVDKKGLGDLAKELSVVSEKARLKQLMPNDMQGGCFSISSLGGIGGTAFTPIVNLPEVAILGISKSAYKPIYQENQFIPRLMLPLSLSYDHRVIDGADGARFITSLAEMLADIRNLLL